MPTGTMASLISHLDPAQRRQLFTDLNYLNMAELRSVCRAHAIPWVIFAAAPDGSMKRTADTDRKSVVLDRVRRYLRTGRVPAATCFPAAVVASGEQPRRLRPTDRLYYGRYDVTNRAMVELLRQLTGGAFRNGAIARILAREFWTAGTAPTFAEFGRQWQRANRAGLGVAAGRHPEAAWLTDRARGEAAAGWKAKRRARARRALSVLAALRRR
jgi:hypothetical protein